MTANAKTQVARMLELVPYLRAREGISVDEVAGDFAVAPAQIVKDLKVLWFCGLPNSVTGDMIDIDMEALDGEGVVKLANADYLTRPLRLAPHEALAMIVALRTLREAAGEREKDAVDRALAKLYPATDASGRAAAVDVRFDHIEPAIRAAVDEALHDRRRLHLRYYVPARDETTERDVDPFRLVFAEGSGYLEAWCHRAQGVRLFRLDRIMAASVLEAPAEPPTESDRPDLSRGLFRPDPADPVAALQLAPTARWVADHYPIEDEQELGDGSLEIRLRYRDEQWLVRLVLRLGGAATILEPAELAERVRKRAKAALANYPA
ncbi:MAG: helix-turn-helix transcriptional regulator [Nocardioidaceae bacterium]